MAANKSQIEGWLRRGKEDGATHVIVVCDKYDYDDYPVFVEPGENPREVADSYNAKSMQKVMEVYDLNMDIEEQLSQRRVFNF